MAISSLTENARSPFHAEPPQLWQEFGGADLSVPESRGYSCEVEGQRPMVTKGDCLHHFAVASGVRRYLPCSL